MSVVLRSLALATTLGAASVVVGQPPFRVGAFIDPAQGISEDTPIRLIIDIEGAGNTSLTPPRISGLTNLRVVAGPQTNHESMWSNGRVSSKTRLIYSLEAEAAGSAAVPAIELTLGNATYRTRPLTFEVSKSRGGAPPRPAPRPAAPRDSGEHEADVFIRAELGSGEVWVGQSVSLAVSLYAAEQVTGFEWAGEPALANYWVEDLEVDPNAESHRTTVEGRGYTVFPLKRKVLVPQTPGGFEIEPYSMRIQVRQRSGDPFDLFSFGRSTTVLRKTQALRLEVRPLPTAGRPPDFSGAVGRYEFQATLDRQETAVNDAVALKATVQGEGFLGAVAAPSFTASADLKVFPPKVSASSRGVRGQMVSRKTWEWVLVPLAPGEVALSDLSFSYFDPAQGSYEEARASLLPLVVRRGDPTQEDAPVVGGEVRLQRRELAFIKPLHGELRAGAPRVHQRSSYRVLLALPLVWVPLLVVASRHRSRLQQNLGLARSRRARSRALKRLRAAGKHLDLEASSSFHEEVGRALVEYVADRFNRSAAGLTYETADELLASRGLDVELRRRFRSCLESCDFARFVPSAAQSERRTEVLSEATQVLESLERAW